MSISKKLYLSFGAILLCVVVLFAVILWAVHHEQSKKAEAG
jgi:Zn-dependent membrane protease YugP